MKDNLVNSVIKGSLKTDTNNEGTNDKAEPHGTFLKMTWECTLLWTLWADCDLSSVLGKEELCHSGRAEPLEVEVL